MKKFITLMLIMVATIVTSQAQTKDSVKVKRPNVVVNEDGNYESVSVPKGKATRTDTGKFFITKSGEKLPVYISRNGKMFVVMTSKKSGKEYPKYLEL